MYMVVQFKYYGYISFKKQMTHENSSMRYYDL